MCNIDLIVALDIQSFFFLSCFDMPFKLKWYLIYSNPYVVSHVIVGNSSQYSLCYDYRVFYIKGLWWETSFSYVFDTFNDMTTVSFSDMTEVWDRVKVKIWLFVIFGVHKNHLLLMSVCCFSLLHCCLIWCVESRAGTVFCKPLDQAFMCFSWYNNQ